ncbi:MAG: hypothetical protein IT204_08040 [Fimbriimonadaceae bacterium]|nr:hypothetical protein [Fimbriimonadaceae bacterium]
MRQYGGLLLGLLATGSALAEKRLTSYNEVRLIDAYRFRGGTRAGTGLIRSGWTQYKLNSALRARFESWSWLQLEAGKGTGESRYTGALEWDAHRLFTLRLHGTWYDRNDEVGNQLFQGPKTTELGGAVTLRVPLRPTLSYWYDLDSNVGSYLQLGVSHRTPVSTNGWLADLSANLGWDFGRQQGFNDAHLRGYLWYELDSHFSVGPGVDLWFPAAQVDPTADTVRADWSLGLTYRKLF